MGYSYALPVISLLLLSHGLSTDSVQVVMVDTACKCSNKCSLMGRFF